MTGMFVQAFCPEADRDQPRSPKTAPPLKNTTFNNINNARSFFLT
jgi:hypothetical protein